MPVLSYWMASAFYGFINAFDFFPQHRIHPTAEECKKNLAKRSYVLRHVLIMHLVQLIAGFPLAKFQAPETAADHSSFNLPFSPFSWLGNASGANIVYHNVHHQSWGLKDQLLNTVYEGKRTLRTPPSPAEVRAWPVKRRLEFFRQLELDELRTANILATRLKIAIRVTREERSTTKLNGSELRHREQVKWEDSDSKVVSTVISVKAVPAA